MLFGSIQFRFTQSLKKNCNFFFNYEFKNKIQMPKQSRTTTDGCMMCCYVYIVHFAKNFISLTFIRRKFNFQKSGP